VTDNPYAPPAARVDDQVANADDFAMPLTGLEFYLRPMGRVGRKDYLLRGVLAIFLFGTLLQLIAIYLRIPWLFPVTGFLCMWPIIALISRRAHDMNLSGHMAWIWVVCVFGGGILANRGAPLYVVSLLSYVVQIGFGLFRGTDGPNDHGLPPPPR
jgi:uncharacterized membrane protein YhaH (DUF805 family)